jgi:FecR protein
MIRRNRIIRLAVAAALGGTMALPPPPARAQDAPPPPDSGAPQPATAGDPPTRAGRLARLSGTVSFHGPGADHWDVAQLNFPVTSGDAVWTEPGAGAAVDISASRLTLSGGSELDIDSLDAQTTVATAPQGEVFVDLRHLAPGESFSLRTPRGTISIAGEGHYDIAAGDTQTPTTVTVIDGAAKVSGNGLDLTVLAGQTATVTGDQAFQGSIGPAVRDAFVTELLSRPAPPPAAQVALPPTVAAMCGSEDLAQYGGWQATPQYGTVWYPQVAADWVPYRDGHWAYVAPWGWTWVDNAPWGFAPFHYGRWVQAGGRWGWAPVYAAPGYVAPAFVEPVYAPALVGFVGLAAGVAIGAAFGGSVGWVPLGWNEPYHPWYGHGGDYLGRVNRGYVANVTNITNITNVTNFNYANRGGATVVPGAVMVGSRPVAGAFERLSPQQLAAFRPAAGPYVRPSAATMGVTPVVARELHLPPAVGGGPGRAMAPGPAFTNREAGRPGVGPVALRPAAVRQGVASFPHVPEASHANVAHLNGAPGPRIVPHAVGMATPALRAPLGRPGAPDMPHTNAGAAFHAAPGPRAVTQLHEAPRAAPQMHEAPRAAEVSHPIGARPASQMHEPARPAPQGREESRPGQQAYAAPRPAASRPAPEAHQAPHPAAPRPAQEAKHCQPGHPC